VIFDGSSSYRLYGLGWDGLHRERLSVCHAPAGQCPHNQGNEIRKKRHSSVRIQDHLCLLASFALPRAACTTSPAFIRIDPAALPAAPSASRSRSPVKRPMPSFQLPTVLVKLPIHCCLFIESFCVVADNPPFSAFNIPKATVRPAGRRSSSLTHKRDLPLAFLEPYPSASTNPQELRRLHTARTEDRSAWAETGYLPQRASRAPWFWDAAPGSSPSSQPT
jgi:hypothetical protein